MVFQRIFQQIFKTVMAGLALIGLLLVPVAMAADTPSGLPVPRFVSLKYGQVNGRTGPSPEHPVAWRYQRRGLPVQVIAETEIWRRIKDPDGDIVWVHKRTLSGDRTVVTLKPTALRKRARLSSPVTARVERDVILTLGECQSHGWCDVRSDDGPSGWIEASAIWGAGQP